MDVRNVSETLTLAVPVLIVCSCIRLITYYHHWNVPILDYLSAAELLLLFVQPALVIAALALMYLAYSLLFGAAAVLVALLQTLRKKPAGNAAASQTKSPQGQTVKERSTIRSALLLIGIIIGLGMGVGMFFNGIWFEFEVIPTVVFHVFLLFGTVGAVHALLPPGEKDNRLKPLVAGAIVVLMSSSFFYGRFQAHDTELHPARVSIALKDDVVIDGDADHIYLGKTNNYYFFHDRTRKQTSVIPVEEVKATYLKSSY